MADLATERPSSTGDAVRGNKQSDLSAEQRRLIGRELVAEYRETLDILAAHDRDESDERTDHRNGG